MPHFQKKIQQIAVYCSGGDAPGMNAALRAVVRAGRSHNIKVIGVQSGYQGIIEGLHRELQAGDVANIIQRGGTIIKTGRTGEMLKVEGRKRAVDQLVAMGADAAVCIGGNGSFTAAHLLWEEFQYPIVGVPGTIDNDIFGTDATIGFDTAVNTALQAIDRIRDTAAAHDRLFIVEVMGRNSGFIATSVGLAGGAEEIFTPDATISVDRAIEKIRQGMARGKKSSILITAEGQKPGRAYDLADSIRKKTGFDAKVCILGHQQRGGSPTAIDRILASRFGAAAIDSLLQGECDVMMGIQGGNLCRVDFKTALGQEKKSSPSDLKLAGILSQ